MSIARKDDRHNEDLVREISDGFNRALGSEKAVEEADAEKRNPPRRSSSSLGTAGPLRRLAGRTAESPYPGYG